MDGGRHEKLAAQVVEAVLSRLGRSDPNLARAVAEEVADALAELSASPQHHSAQPPPRTRPSADPAAPPARASAHAQATAVAGSHAELQQAVAEHAAHASGSARWAEPPAERVVVTANGRNRSGIVARLATAIDELGGDIRDLSQTLVGDYFTMLFVVDIAGATRQGARFAQLRRRLQEVGEEIGVHVVVLHDDILSSMHSI